MTKNIYTKLTFLLLLLFSSSIIFGQTIYVTSSGSTAPSENFLNITTGIDGTGTVIWEQSTALTTCDLSGGGELSDVAVDISAFCGQTIYANAYDRWADGWNFGEYEIWSAPGQTGTLIVNNGGATPDDGSGLGNLNFCDDTDELEVSESFTVACQNCTAPVSTSTYDCATNMINVNVTDIGASSTAGNLFTINIDNGPVLPTQTIVATGTYSFGPVTPDQTYNITITNGEDNACDVNVLYLYPDCVNPAPGCTDPVTNGDFESATGWTEVSTLNDWLFGISNTGVPVIDAERPLDGLQSAFLGGWGGSGAGEDLFFGGGAPYTTEVSQTVTLTAGNTPTLYFMGLYFCDSAADVFSVLVNGTVVLSLPGNDATCGDLTWHEYAIDLSAYAGTSPTITLQLIEQGTEANGGDVSNFFVDDLRIEDCPSILCDVPVGTATYDCFTNEMTVNITNTGGPNGGPYQLSVGGAAAQTITATGNYTFTGLVSNQTYPITADDGAGCVTTIATVAATCPCINPTGTAAYDCFNNEMDVTISTTGTPYDPVNNPYLITVTGGPTVAGQTINAAGVYTFTGLTPNVTYTVTADDGAGCSVVLGTVLADCACLLPEVTVSYNCTGDYVRLDVTNPGSPTGSYSASIDGGTPLTLDFVGNSSPTDFSGLSPMETYNMVIDDGAGCSTSIDYIYGGCRTPGPQCNDVITNGGFENGSPGWTQTALGVLGGGTTNVYEGTDPHINTQFALEGTQAALLGRYGGSDPPVAGTTGPYTSTLSKSILPTNGYTATIHFWGYWETCNNTSDRLEIVVDGNVEATFNAAGAFCGDDKWHEYSVDISAYADGTTAAIDIRLVETGSGPSRFHIDDIMVENCPPDISCPAAYGGLAGVAPDMSDYETDGNIASLQTIAAGTTVDYDAGTQIDMVQGFTVELGATFCAFIDGCNGTGGVVNPLVETDVTNALQAEDTPTTMIFTTSKAVRSKKIIQSNEVALPVISKEVNLPTVSNEVNTAAILNTKTKTFLSVTAAKKSKKQANSNKK